MSVFQDRRSPRVLVADTNIFIPTEYVKTRSQFGGNVCMYSSSADSNEIIEALLTS